MRTIIITSLFALTAVACEQKPAAPAAPSPAPVAAALAPAAAAPVAAAPAPADEAADEAGDEALAAEPAEPAEPAAAEPAAAPATGDFDLRIVRRLAQGHAPVTPPGGTVDGDFNFFETSTFGECGYLYKTRPYEAIFLFCGGKPVTGPMTTVEEVNAAEAELAEASRAGHELRMGIMKNWPKTRTRVYDQYGNHVRDE